MTPTLAFILIHGLITLPMIMLMVWLWKVFA